MALFSDIPSFTRESGYMVNIAIDSLPSYLTHLVLEYGFDTSPDFQRPHVWTLGQKVRFIEYMLRGGQSGMDIYTNSPRWYNGDMSPEGDSWFVLVDGKQRIDAVSGFLNGDFPVFGGNYFEDYTDRPRMARISFRWHVNNLATRGECLQWYLDLNQGGTVHTEEEIGRVKSLLDRGVPYEKPSLAGLVANAGLDGSAFTKARQEYLDEKRRLEESRNAPRPEPKVKKGRRK